MQQRPETAQGRIPYREIGTWRADVTDWTCEPDGTVTVHYRVKRTDLGGILGAKPRSHSGTAILRFGSHSPHTQDATLLFCENHWD